MAKITFITRDDETVELEGTSGSIMQLAVDNNVKGIDGDCGGVCSCATCHVYIPPAYFGKVGEATDIEKDMLELDDNVNEYSRLSCQIEITEELEGIIIEVAK